MKKITAYSLILFFALLASVENSYSQSTTVTIKPPLGALDDASVASDNANTNMGNGNTLLSMTWTCQSALCHMASYMNFDLSVIPSTANIDSAFLYLHADIPDAAISGQPTYGTDDAAWISRVTQSWNENTITWNTQPSSTTQNQTTIPQSTSPVQDYVINVTALLQDMIDNPASSFGFTITEKNQTTYYNSLIFASNYNSDTARAPKLVITYTDLSSVNDIYGKNSGISIFPDPATDELTIQSAKFAVQNVEIYTIIGTKVYSQLQESSNLKPMIVNVSELSKGIYFVKVNGENAARIAKFVKE